VRKIPISIGMTRERLYNQAFNRRSTTQGRNPRGIVDAFSASNLR